MTEKINECKISEEKLEEIMDAIEVILTETGKFSPGQLEDVLTEILEELRGEE